MRFIEERLAALNELAMVRMPGTIIQQVLYDNELLRDMGLFANNANHQSTRVWTVGIGEMNQRKVFGVGYTIGDAIIDAESKIREILASNQRKPTCKKNTSKKAKSQLQEKR